MSELLTEVQAALNRASAESGSNTPDFILACYLLACLDAFEVATREREVWYGRDPRGLPPLAP